MNDTHATSYPGTNVSPIILNKCPIMQKLGTANFVVKLFLEIMYNYRLLHLVHSTRMSHEPKKVSNLHCVSAASNLV